MKRRILLIEIGPKLFLTGILPAAALGTAYSASVSARGGTAPYQYRVIAGALPGGWALEPFSGVIAGTTDTAGLYTFMIEAIDARGATTSKSFAVRVQAEPLQISGNYPDAEVGSAYSADLTIAGGAPPYSNPRITSGSLPSGLALSVVGDKLRLAGTPAAKFDASFMIAVDDSGGRTASSEQTMVVTEPAGISARYWRLYITKGGSGNVTSGYMNLGLIALQSTSGGDNQCDGAVRSQCADSSHYQASLAAYYAFANPHLDGSKYAPGNYWHSNFQSQPWWATIDAGDGKLYSVRAVTISPTNLSGRWPVDFEIQTSSDGSNWTTVATYTGITDWVLNQPKSFAVPNP